MKVIDLNQHPRLKNIIERLTEICVYGVILETTDFYRSLILYTGRYREPGRQNQRFLWIGDGRRVLVYYHDGLNTLEIDNTIDEEWLYKLLRKILIERITR
jgi:hypothetical protein